MFSRIEDRNIWLVDGAIFLLGLAYGISISLVGLFLDAKGYAKEDIGDLAVWFGLGIVALSLPMGALIRRFSARASLVVCLGGYACAVAAFPFLPDYTSIAAVRFFDGAFSVGVWVSCETILLTRSGPKNKAFVTSLYAMAMASGYVIGPFAAQAIVTSVSMEAAFVASGIVAALAMILVLARLDPDPAIDPHAEPGEGGEPARPDTALTLFWRIKTSCLATFSYGYFQASLVLVLPLYLRDVKHVSQDRTIVMPAIFAAGMLLFSNVAGRLGDRFGHLLMMRVLGAVGTMAVLGFIFIDDFATMCVAVFVGGAALASISPLSLALQGVVTEPRNMSRANAIYNLFYAGGMLLGPPISFRIFDAQGGVPMLYHQVAMWVAFLIFTIVFYRDDPAVSRLAGRTATA